MLKPELLEPLQQSFQQLQKNIENDEIDAVCATIIRLAKRWIMVFGIFRGWKTKPRVKRKSDSSSY